MVAVRAHQELFQDSFPADFPKLTRIFEKSKTDFWNESDAIDWDRPIDLPQEKREALARVLSIIYYGERAAMTIAGQLVGMVPHEEAKQALACQAMEEAKHVSAFRRLLEKLDRVYPPSYFAKRLLTDLIETDDPCAKMVGMHLFVENIANHTFQAIQKHIDEPLTEKILEYVARDERKHVAIAVLYLPELLEKLPKRKLVTLYAKQAKWLTYGMGMVKDGYPYARVLNIDLAAAGQKALRDHHRLRSQLTTRRGLLDIPGFEKVIDLIGAWASPDEGP